jgi:Tol biopolymer transport system component
MQRARHALAILWLLGLVGVPAHADYFGQNRVQYRPYSWRSIESGGFRVFFSGALDSLALRVLDLAETASGVFERRLDHRLGQKLPIILCGSHNDFAQSNVVPERIERRAGGFTEQFQNRLVVAFTGSQDELRHVLWHELAHAFLFDIVYGGSAARTLCRQSFFSVPFWFSEGLAEHLSLGMDPEMDMVMRDAVIAGGVPALEAAGGYLGYKQGQSAIGYMVERYGEQRLRELLGCMRRAHSFHRAFQRVIGVSVREFEEQWRAWLRRRYWPSVVSKQAPAQFGRRLTDHRRDGGAFNTAPAVSLQGDRIAFFSDRRRYTDAYVMSAYDGGRPRRLVGGERSVLFETFPSFRSAICWSPEGERLALVAKRGGREVLLVVSADDGRVLDRLDPGCDALADPAWSPVADSVVVSGVKDGVSDLWLLDLGAGTSQRLTHDAWDERESCWLPDGKGITFASDRPVTVESAPERAPAGHGRYGLFDLDLGTGIIMMRLATAGNDRSPAWSPDGRKLAFLTDRDGARNLVLFETETRRFTQLTDVIGGVSSLSWSRQDDRLVFAAYDRGGCDVFAVEEPVSVDAVLARLRRRLPQGAVRGSGVGEPPFEEVRASAPPGAAPTLPDSLRAQEPVPHRPRLSPDRLGVSVFAAPGFGFVASTTLSFGDLMGDHRLSMTIDPFGGSLRETNALAVYRYLPRRWDLDVGVFHFRDYYASRVSAIGDAVESPRLYTQRAFGGVIGASRPFDRFRRLDLALTQAFVERTSCDDDAPVAGRTGGRRYESVSSPSVSLVGDNTLWGMTGPVIGGRYNLSYSPSLAWLPSGLAYHTVTLDARRYWSLTGDYSVACRLLAGRSDGRDAQRFSVGGFSTLRGLEDYSLAGTRIAILNAELRFPFIERLGEVGAIPLGGLDLRGALFGDVGLIWDEGERLRLTHVVGGARRLHSPRVGFGVGARTRIAFMVVKLDVAWPTDLAGAGRPRWGLAIGPEF